MILKILRVTVEPHVQGGNKSPEKPFTHQLINTKTKKHTFYAVRVVPVFHCEIRSVRRNVATKGWALLWAWKNYGKWPGKRWCRWFPIRRRPSTMLLPVFSKYQPWRIVPEQFPTLNGKFHRPNPKIMSNVAM